MSITSYLIRSTAVGAVVPVALAGVALAAVWTGLPDTVAVHWGPSGAADGFMARSTGLVVVSLGLPVATFAVLLVVMATTPASAPGGRWLRALPGGVCWFVVGLTTLATTAQVGAGGADTPLRGWWIPSALALGILGTVLVAFALPAPPPMPGRQGAPSPAAPRLAADTTGPVLWTGTAPRARFVGLVAAGALLPGVVLAALDAWWALLLIVPAGLLVVASASFRITVGAQSIVVAGGFFGWPRLSVPLSTVVEARPTTTGIWEWGGWGLRVRPRGTGVITRAGEALELCRTDDTTVVITLDDADTAAAAVNTLLDRA